MLVHACMSMSREYKLVMFYFLMQDELKSNEQVLARLQTQAWFLTRVNDCGPFSVRNAPRVPKASANQAMLKFEATECSACGAGFADDDIIELCMLPCRHPYHLYCLGLLCSLQNQCNEVGCDELISEVVKKRFCCIPMLQPTGSFKTPKSKSLISL